MAVMDDSKKLEVLMAHYQEAVGELDREIRLRLKLLFAGAGIMALLLFGAGSPDLAQDLLNTWIEGQLAAKDTSVVDLRFVTSVLWFALSSVVSLFYARSLAIERQARYLRRLEQRITDLAGHDLVSRYRDARKSRNLFFRTFNVLYSGTFLVLLAAATLFVLSSEWGQSGSDGQGFLFVDLFLGLSMLALAVVFAISFYDEMKHPDGKNTDADQATAEPSNRNRAEKGPKRP